MIRVSRVATDDDINKGNSIYKLVRKLCSTVTLVRKLMCLMMIGSFVPWRARKDRSAKPSWKGAKTYESFSEKQPTCLNEGKQDLPIYNENYRAHSSVGQSVWLITIRSPVQAWMGPLQFFWRRTLPTFHLFRMLGPAKLSNHSQDTVFEFRRRMI